MKQFGQERDLKILDLISHGKAFTRPQIEQIIFPHIKLGARQRKANARLKKMIDQKMIKSQPYFPNPYFYVTKPKQIDHTLIINDVYCSLLKQKKSSWYKIDFRWRYEIFGGMVVADALIIIDTLPDGKGRQVIFLEVERSPSKRFDKDVQYKRVYDSDYSKEEWCVMRGDIAQFPSILIVTDEKLKIESSLRFIVATPEQVKKDVYSLILRR